MDSRVENKHRSKRRKWLYWAGGGLLLIVIGIGIYLLYLYDQVSDTVDTMHNPLDRDDNPERQKELDSIFKDTKSINILLLGVDEREHDKGRSDTMILVSMNPQTDSMKMLSIPRDTRVPIPGYGMDKINHAYAYEGVGLSVQTVHGLLDVPVHFYVKVNMEGFKQGVDALGGVTVQNDTAFSHKGKDFPTGEIHLNGEEALKYIRKRKGLSKGDIGRNERQRAVIQAAIDKGSSFSSITKVTDILNIIGDNVKTDLQMKQMRALLADYRQTRNNIDSMEMNGSGQYIGGLWYYMVPDEEINRIQTEIKNHMQAR